MWPSTHFLLTNFIGKCSYKTYGADLVVTDEGSTVAQEHMNAEECKEYCDFVSDCKSFAVCGSDGRCYLKDKPLTGNEATRKIATCNSYYLDCGGV